MSWDSQDGPDMVDCGHHHCQLEADIVFGIYHALMLEGGALHNKVVELARETETNEMVVWTKVVERLLLMTADAMVIGEIVDEHTNPN